MPARRASKPSRSRPRRTAQSGDADAARALRVDAERNPAELIAEALGKAGVVVVAKRTRWFLARHVETPSPVLEITDRELAAAIVKAAEAATLARIFHSLHGLVTEYGSTAHLWKWCEDFAARLAGRRGFTAAALQRHYLTHRAALDRRKCSTR